MTVIVPADDIETYQATLAIAGIPGPVYLRLGRYPVPRLNRSDYQFQVGKMTRLRDGEDIVIFATGHMVWKAMETADLLIKDQINARIINVSTIKPLDVEAVHQEVAGIEAVYTIEEHNIVGGLGSAIAEVLAEDSRSQLIFKRLGVCDAFGESGLADELLEVHGLQPEGIYQSIKKSLLNPK